VSEPPVQQPPVDASGRPMSEAPQHPSPFDDPCTNKDTFCLGGMHLPRSPFVWVAACFFLYLSSQAYRKDHSDEATEYVGVALAILGVGHQVAKNAARLTGIGRRVADVSQQTTAAAQQAAVAAQQTEVVAQQVATVTQQAAAVTQQAVLLKEAVRDIQDNPALPGTPGQLDALERGRVPGR
jgi:hypothetical protein